MAFNSLVFAAFFVIVYAIYLALGRRHKVQNLILLAASYVFYGYWDWRFMGLLLVSTSVDYIAGGAIFKSESKGRRRFFLLLSVGTNLVILGFFKYFNFFTQSFTELLQVFGMEADYVLLNLILPVGISFYTFQSMSYTIDIYRGKLRPTPRVLDFALYVSFFPQLVAGPIERAVNLLPQISGPRKIKAPQVNAALFLLLWGYFKKMVVADNLARISNEIFNNYTQYEGMDVVLGLVAFSLQIYCDFSGYSDIARGLAKLMGFELMVNFKLPYFAASPRDFWRRWHISLSTWLRDYLYIPLGGNRRGRLRSSFNLLITMLLGGLWHGARWNFVIWGAYHGVILGVYRWLGGKPSTREPGRMWKFVSTGLRVCAMLVVTGIGWMLFRCETASQIYYMLTNMGLEFSGTTKLRGYEIIFYALPMIIVQVFQHVTRDLLIVTRQRAWAQAVFYGWLVVWIFVFGVRESIDFIYFQF